ncbi:hypothetical protein BZB76_1749 [Actinomadura pelletieri DSM 43383]|uniref:Uncharacterized protein n=1 Tax=Actinomadura pelletieri DSM 43383 TaxID=1120940 RepID=A0A495QSA4_9ACTN|nr:hypothetical protein [Actinomadura pelletieri]RKS76394.1 hypothetical protein BZB76_1749 [Actinomadura pelletieri DSM 43383]
MNVAIVLAFALGTVTGLVTVVLLVGCQRRGGRHIAGSPRRTPGRHTY